jgi:hypothetical protein
MKTRRLFPVLALALLSPFVAEILFGATPVSRVASLPPLLLLYGGGAVLIRELTRRISGGWAPIVLLAAAYALIEEGLVMQTLYSPDLFNAASYGGRFLGVNWVWTEALIGYHIVWSIVIPIALVELCFPERRAQPWLGRTGVAVALGCYTLGALGIAITFRRFLTPHFRASVTLLLATALTAAVLVTRVLRAKPHPVTEATIYPHAKTINPLLAGLAALVAAGIWFQLLALPQPLRRGPRVVTPIILEACLAAGFVALIRWWSVPPRRWTDLHRVALIAGALIVSMMSGVSTLTTARPFDRYAQALSCGLTVFFLTALALRVQKKNLAVPRPVPA